MLPASGQKLVQSIQRSFAVATRSLASAASAPLTDPLEDVDILPQKKPSQSDVKVSKLGNGIAVASCDSGGAVSRVVVAVQAGSRVESKTQLGLSHLLKNAAFLSNGGRSQLRTVRETQQTGGSVECTSSREFISRNGVFLRDKLPEMMENIAPGITSPLFKAWELGQVKEQCKGDIASLDSTAVNFELLHKTAFRTGLGNSVFCSSLKVDGYSDQDLDGFVNQFHVGGGMTVAGTNVDHDELVRYSEELLGGIPSGASKVAPSQYHGGEVRMCTGNGFAYATLAGLGTGLSSADLPAFAVLQRVLGYGAAIKWGRNTTSSMLNKAVQSVTQGPFLISALNISYSDAGLFGVHAVSTATDIGAVLHAAVNEVNKVSSGDISAEDVENAKNQVKANVLMLTEGSEERIDDLLKQVVFTGGYATPAGTLRDIDAVSVDKVVEISKQVFGGKLTLAVTGDTSYAPYLDELV